MAERISGDCPVCGKYSSQTTCVWRYFAFCCDEHKRKFIWEVLSEEALDENEELWEDLANATNDTKES